LSFLLCLNTFSLLDVSDGSAATGNEFRLQSDRERLLESQLTYIIKQLRSRTILAMREQKKLKKECHQATQQLKGYEDQCLAGEKYSSEILGDAEDATKQLKDLTQQPRPEQAALDDYRATVEKVEEFGEIFTSFFEDWITNSKHQDLARDTIKALETSWKRSSKNEARPVSKTRINELQELLDKINKRKIMCLIYMDTSGKTMHTFAVHVLLSYSRQKRIQSLLHQGGMKFESIMQKVKLTEMAAEKELDVAVDRKKKCKEVLHLSSERLKNIQQQILLVANRQRSLEEFESTCGRLLSAPDLLQQTSSENDSLKEQLQKIFKIEEHLMTNLQELYKREKESLKTLKHSSESVNVASVPIICERMKRLEKLIEKETKLQIRIDEERRRHVCLAKLLTQITNSDVHLREEINRLLKPLDTSTSQQTSNESGQCLLLSRSLGL